VTKRAAAAALILDASARILCVKPTYRPEWLVPGGAVELGESPLCACRREVREETGLQLSIGRLLCVDYRFNARLDAEILHFVFWGGELSGAEVAKIALPTGELSEYGFLPLDEATAVLDRPLGRRIRAALDALREDTSFYLENGERPDFLRHESAGRSDAPATHTPRGLTPSGTVGLGLGKSPRPDAASERRNRADTGSDG